MVFVLVINTIKFILDLISEFVNDASSNWTDQVKEGHNKHSECIVVDGLVNVQLIGPSILIQPLDCL